MAVLKRQQIVRFQWGNILKVIVGYVALLIFCFRVEYVEPLLAGQSMQGQCCSEMGNISTLEQAWLLGLGRYVQFDEPFLQVGCVEVLGCGYDEKSIQCKYYYNGQFFCHLNVFKLLNFCYHINVFNSQRIYVNKGFRLFIVEYIPS